MALDGKGHKGFLQLARETAGNYGVANPTATHRIPYVDVDISKVQGLVRDEAYDGTLQRRGIYQATVHYEGTITFHLTYQALNMVWDLIFGTDTYGSNGGTTTGPVSGVYTHTFIERQFANSWTVQQIEGDVPTGLCSRYLGLKAEGFSIACAPGSGADAWPMLVVKVVARDKQTGQAITGALTSLAVLPAMFHQITTKGDGSADPASDIILRNLSLEYNWPLTRQFDAGSLLLVEPVRTSWPDCTWTIEKNLRTISWETIARAATLAAITWEWTNGLVKVKLESGTCYPADHKSPKLGEYGVLGETMKWEAVRDATQLTGLRGTMVNAQSSVTA